NVLAKALFDNVAESPDELSFRKGDIMTVLERDTQGLDGWWLCSLHGRQGIVPGNRLKILVGMYDGKQATPTGGALSPPPASQTQAAYAQLPGSSSSSSAPYPGGKPLPSSQYTSMHSAYSMPTPAKPYHGNVYMMPPSHGGGGGGGGGANKAGPQSLYQVPPGPMAPPQPPSKARSLAQKQYHAHGQDIYQVPPSLGPAPGQGAAPGTVGQDIYQVGYDYRRLLSVQQGMDSIVDLPDYRRLSVLQYGLYR
ncbi:hypothetical protein CRUP_036135, partial [Coryphaenoides rupestris]